jgi:radical SAM-linked protein
MVQITSFDGPVLEKPKTLRIRFQKTGALKYISHLDLMRTMTRVIARVHLPIKYTCGFHPIPHLVFSAPLPVGAESPHEFLDVAVLRELDPAAVVTLLNNGLPAGLAVDAAYFAETKFQSIASAEYLITIHAPGASEDVAKYCGDILAEKPITVLKHTKSGDKNVDVSPAVLDVDSSFDQENGDIVLRIRLRADSGSFLNPDYLLRYLSDQTGLLKGSPLEEWYTVTRTHLFDANGKDFV